MVDISGVSDSAKGLQAAILSACWGVGLGLIELSGLADRGSSPACTLPGGNELHRALRVSKGMVERIDLLTPNRKQAVGLVLCTHTMADLEILPDEEDRKAARGFVERCGMVALAALPQREIPYLGEVVHLSHAEQELLHQWRTPESWSSELISGEPGDEDQVPHGLEVPRQGSVTGQDDPVQVTLRSIERQLHDTNKRWHERERPQFGAGGGHVRAQHRHATGTPAYSPVARLAAGLLALAALAVEIAVHAGSSLDHLHQPLSWYHREIATGFYFYPRF